jgi:adenosylcobyric acid synthase
MPALMVQGTSSWAGKSLITTALCRHFARRGVRVAPFKAQNMSNNARVVEGGEIGVAQYLQARAAQVEPDVRMNPVLIKPEAMMQSQVVVAGQVDHELSALPWRERAPHLWPPIASALRSLLAEYELVVLEGAGSPAEINLIDCDLANNRSADFAAAPVLLVSDIDRGGAFAHLYGTWALLPEHHRRWLAGFVLNKFRGDASLLAPAPERLQELTGVPMLGVVPWLEHGLPDEDGAAEPLLHSELGPSVAVVRYPTASNLDEFKALEQVARVRWARSPTAIEDADLVVLPGSKHVSTDLAWLRANGFDQALHARVVAGGRILGICGGLQMLGERIDGGEIEPGGDGLGLLALRTAFARNKLTRRRCATFSERLAGPWAALAGRSFDGYEIRHGRTSASEALEQAIPDDAGWVDGPVLAVTVHGVLEAPGVLEALFGAVPQRRLDETLDELATAVIGHVDADRIEALAAI